MKQCNHVKNIEISYSQLDKSKSAIKNESEVTLILSDSIII